MRTHILICSGAGLFTIASVYGFVLADPGRVAAGIVTGIGFLGATPVAIADITGNINAYVEATFKQILTQMAALGLITDSTTT